MKEMALSDSLKKALQDSKKNTMVEDFLRDQVRTWVKELPPLPLGWVYEFIQGEPKYNPNTESWEASIEARPRQKYIIKED